MVLINEWAYFQPAGDSGMNKRNGGNMGIGCNGTRSNGTSNFQRPIMSCINESKDQQQPHHPHQHQQNHSYNVNHMLHAQNQQQQQQQVIMI